MTAADQSTTERDLITDLGDLMVIWDRLSDRIDALLTERAEMLEVLKLFLKETTIVGSETRKMAAVLVAKAEGRLKEREP